MVHARRVSCRQPRFGIVLYVLAFTLVGSVAPARGQALYTAGGLEVTARFKVGVDGITGGMDPSCLKAGCVAGSLDPDCYYSDCGIKDILEAEPFCRHTVSGETFTPPPPPTGATWPFEATICGDFLSICSDSYHTPESLPLSDTSCMNVNACGGLSPDFPDFCLPGGTNGLPAAITQLQSRIVYNGGCDNYITYYFATPKYTSDIVTPYDAPIPATPPDTRCRTDNTPIVIEECPGLARVRFVDSVRWALDPHVPDPLAPSLTSFSISAYPAGNFSNPLSSRFPLDPPSTSTIQFPVRGGEEVRLDYDFSVGNDPYTNLRTGTGTAIVLGPDKLHVQDSSSQVIPCNRIRDFYIPIRPDTCAPGGD